MNMFNSALLETKHRILDLRRYFNYDAIIIPVSRLSNRKNNRVSVECTVTTEIYVIALSWRIAGYSLVLYPYYSSVKMCSEVLGLFLYSNWTVTEFF